jgi:DNA-directed RNA polymerase specialized sigma24 family protein
MSGETLQKFNEFFTSNYNKLLTYCYDYRISADYLHQAYLNTYDKIQKTGWTGNSYTTYIIRSVVNLDINDKKSLKNRNVVNIDTENPLAIENKLEEIKTEDEINELIRQRNEYIVRELFQFLQYHVKCTEIEMMIFKIYYLSKTKMSYVKIKQLTGVNKNRVTIILRKIKKQINENFINYLNAK